MADISYNKTTWVNGTTALNADNLNNIEIGVDNATKAINNKVDKVAGKGLSTNDFNDHYKNAIDNLQGEGGISVIELIDKNGTIASAQLVKIGENPQNFVFKYQGKILSFTKADSTTYQYCNNTTNSSDNNVGTVSTILTITSSTGAYTITENVHNVVANAAHPANGGDLTNIQVGSKVYSIPSGGGKSVPPTLWLIDLDNLEARTTITEEEYNNLKNQLYNQVIYFPDTDYNDAYYLSKLVYAFNEFSFVQCHAVYDDTLNSDRIISLIQYYITIGEKDTNGNYPITIEKGYEMPFGSGSGSGEGITPKPITSTADYASLTDTDYFISVRITNNSNVKSGIYILSGNKANGYSYWYPEDKSEGLNMQTYWHYIHYDSTGLTAIIFTSFLDVTDNNKVGFSFDSKFPNNHIFGGFAVRQVPLFSKYTLVTNTTDEITPILPCTTADNGKVLSVVNGEAQWASAGSGGVSVTFED